MKSLTTFSAPSRREWRQWLRSHCANTAEIWLVYYKKHTGKPTVLYHDAVEEAICFGWIDGQIRRVDDDRYMQRFSPRRRTSKWSAINSRRAKEMIRQRLMTEAGLAAFKSGRAAEDSPRPPIPTVPKEFPDDVKAALAKNKKAAAHFATLPPSAVRMALGWILNAKKLETRKRRIDEVVAASARAERIGMK